jgi:hypothetical protein
LATLIDGDTQVARDAAESGVDIQLFGMADSNNSTSSDDGGATKKAFDVGKFYKRILVTFCLNGSGSFRGLSLCDSKSWKEDACVKSLKWGRFWFII